MNKNGRIDFDDLEWEYLKGDGDFRSEEVCKLRDEADVIVTNPPFSMFREFLAWMLEGYKHTDLLTPNGVRERVSRVSGEQIRVLNKKFLIIGSMNTCFNSVFDKVTARKAYERQTAEAKTAGVSNCPLCAVCHDANARRIYDFKEMEADHVTAWSKGGDTSEANCQMLCKTHNRVKGNA